MNTQTMELTSEQEEIEQGTAKLKSLFGSIAESIKVVSDEEDAENERRIKTEQLDRDRQNYYEGSSGVGTKYLNLKLSDYEAETEEQKINLTKVQKFISDVNSGKPRTLWLIGANGNGKTMLGSLICRETFGNFARVYEIEDDLKDAMSYSSKTTRKGVFRKYLDYDVLVVDEIGRYPSDSEKQNLFHILNDRYENQKSTVLISNLDAKGLKEYLGKALVDRFLENCTSVLFTGESYRLKTFYKNRG